MNNYFVSLLGKSRLALETVILFVLQRMTVGCQSLILDYYSSPVLTTFPQSILTPRELSEEQSDWNNQISRRHYRRNNEVFGWMAGLGLATCISMETCSITGNIGNGMGNIWETFEKQFMRVGNSFMHLRNFKRHELSL